MKTVNRIFKWISVVFFSIVVLITVFFLITSFGLGWRYQAVVSGSMEPALQVGGFVAVIPTSVESISVGDIISFTSEGKQVAHRAIDVGRDEKGNFYFQTQGDANDSPDTNPVTVAENETIGEIKFHISYLGFLLNYKKYLPPIFILTFVCLAVLVFRDYIWKGFKEEKEKRKVKRRVSHGGATKQKTGNIGMQYQAERRRGK